MSSVPSSSSLIVFSVTAYMLSNLSLNCLILIIISFSLLGDMTDSSFKYAFLLLIFSSLFYLFLKKTENLFNIHIKMNISNFCKLNSTINCFVGFNPSFFFSFQINYFFPLQTTRFLQRCLYWNSLKPETKVGSSKNGGLVSVLFWCHCPSRITLNSFFKFLEPSSWCELRA